MSRMTILVIVSLAAGIIAWMVAADQASHYAASEADAAYDRLQQTAANPGSAPREERGEMPFPFQYPWLTGIVVAGVVFLIGRMILVALNVESAAISRARRE